MTIARFPAYLSGYFAGRLLRLSIQLVPHRVWLRCPGHLRSCLREYR